MHFRPAQTRVEAPNSVPAQDTAQLDEVHAHLYILSVVCRLIVLLTYFWWEEIMHVWVKQSQACHFCEDFFSRLWNALLHLTLLACSTNERKIGPMVQTWRYSPLILFSFLPIGIQLLLGTVGHPAVTVFLNRLWLSKVCMSKKHCWNIQCKRRKRYDVSYSEGKGKLFHLMPRDSLFIAVFRQMGSLFRVSEKYKEKTN